jgi:hypothetical protein
VPDPINHATGATGLSGATDATGLSGQFLDVDGGYGA